MSRQSYLFTSESVSEGHPDKVCDRISDEIVDLFYREGPKAGIDPWAIRAACETLATTNQIVIAGETHGPSTVTHDWISDVARMAVLLAGLPGSMRAIIRPRSVRATAATPVSGRITWPRSISCGATRVIVAEGMAKPTPVFWPVALAMAVFMPIS